MDRRSFLAALAAATAGCSGPKRIAVGCKNFTEQLVLGEIIAQQIERTMHQRVQRRFNLGGTLVAHQALRNGQIDLYPEYTGTALIAVLKQKPSADAASVLKSVQDAYRNNFQVAWLPPLGFNDTFAMVIRGETARILGIQTLTQAAAAKQDWQLGVGPEFAQRSDGLASLNRAYGLRYIGSPRSMDLGLLYQALDQRQVTMVAGNSTDGVLSARDLVILEDDRHAFPPYQACVAVRTGALSEFPGLDAALQSLNGKLTARQMQRLNFEVDSEHHPVREVAQDFLATLSPAAT